MRHQAIVAVCALALTGCASAPADTAAVQPTGSPAGNAAVSVIGTPFFLAFKGVVCVASAVVAAPVAALASLSPDPSTRHGAVDALGEGLGQNCGPPYVVSP